MPNSTRNASNNLYGPNHAADPDNCGGRAEGTTRMCTRCLINQNVENFSRRSNGNPQSWCRECMNAYARERRRTVAARPGANSPYGPRSVPHLTTLFDQMAVMSIGVLNGLAQSQHDHRDQMSPAYNRMAFTLDPQVRADVTRQVNDIVDLLPVCDDTVCLRDALSTTAMAVAAGPQLSDSDFADLTFPYREWMSAGLMRPTGITTENPFAGLVPEDVPRIRRRIPRVNRTPAFEPPATLSDRNFGVEIETGATLNMRAAAQRLVEMGLDVEAQDYNHSVRTYWKIVPDGSVSGGFEVVSPILTGREGRRELRRMMSALREIGCTTNGSCGLHVHHDVRDLTGQEFYNLVLLWRDNQNLIDGLVSRSRREGRSQWCRNVDNNTINSARRLFEACPGPIVSHRDFERTLSVDRYQTLNLASFPRQGTVEVRQHQGTLNATKALAWVQLGQGMIQLAKDVTDENPAPTAATIRDLLGNLESAGMDSTAAAYLSDRADAFAGGTATA